LVQAGRSFFAGLPDTFLFQSFFPRCSVYSSAWTIHLEGSLFFFSIGLTKLSVPSLGGHKATLPFVQFAGVSSLPPRFELPFFTFHVDDCAHFRQSGLDRSSPPYAAILVIIRLFFFYLSKDDLDRTSVKDVDRLLFFCSVKTLFPLFRFSVLVLFFFCFSSDGARFAWKYSSFFMSFACRLLRLPPSPCNHRFSSRKRGLPPAFLLLEAMGFFPLKK